MRTTLSGLVLAAALSLSTKAPGQAANSWTIPGTVNAGGLNNTSFVSDVALTNSTAAPAQATIAFLPASGAPPTPVRVTLAAGETVVYQNVLERLWGAQGAGATQVSSPAALLIRARTYNTAASGTFGVALPVFADDRLLSAGEAADSLWVSQSADGGSGYRTNVAVVFPDPEGGEADVVVSDADGNEIGFQAFSRDTPGFQQFSVGSFAAEVPIARARVQVVRGRAAGYSVVVDNVTGDGSLFTFESLPAGRQDVLVNGVARANGRNGTFFRTDGRFYNPSSEDAKVTVAFHANQNENLTPLTKDFTVPAGKIRDVVDVLDSLLGLPVGSAGALRFTSDTPVAILCRTSNVDPAGVRPGSFGSQQKPTPLLSFLMSADAGAAVTAIRQNGAFRTNIGFAAGSDGADYALTLKDAAGAAIGTAAGSLGAFGWTQPNVADLFPTTAIPASATLVVTVSAGSVDVFDSSIDNASGDSVVTPIMPLPAEIPSSATIGPRGGSVRSADGALTLKVPAGALGASTPISIAATTNDAPAAVGPGYDVSPAGLSFAKPALLALRYGTSGVPAEGIEGLAVMASTGAGWAGLTGGEIDASSGSLVIGLRSTSPAGAPRASRASLAASVAKMTFAASGAITVKTPRWIPTKGYRVLEVVPVGIPSSTGNPYGYVLANTGTVNHAVRWGKPDHGSLDSTTAVAVNYTAPSRISGATAVEGGSVMVTTVITNQDRTTTTYKDPLKYQFNLIRRYWKLSAYYSLQTSCPIQGNVSYWIAEPVSTYNYFTLNDDLTLTPNPPIVPHSVPTVPSMESCSGCQVTVTSVPGDFVLQNLSGRFLPEASGFYLEGEVFQKNAYPPFELSHCPPSGGSADGVYDGADLWLPGLVGPDSVRHPGMWPVSNDLLAGTPVGDILDLFTNWVSIGELPPAVAR